MTSPSRQFWIEINTPYGDPCDFVYTYDPVAEAKRTGTHCCAPGAIHVIEMSAFLALQQQADLLAEALGHYANHESVIKEAYHSNDTGQITCVHTFINHKAHEALAAYKAYRGGEVSQATIIIAATEKLFSSLEKRIENIEKQLGRKFHGNSGYTKGCRCDVCKNARKLSMRKYRTPHDKR